MPVSTTVRVTNIDPQTKPDRLDSLFESHGCKPRKIVLVLSSCSATVTFKDEAALLKICKLGDEELFKLDGKILRIDRRFLGFTTLYDGPNSTVE
jgi:hypothetical protein